MPNRRRQRSASQSWVLIQVSATGPPWGFVVGVSLVCTFTSVLGHVCLEAYPRVLSGMVGCKGSDLRFCRPAGQRSLMSAPLVLAHRAPGPPRPRTPSPPSTSPGSSAPTASSSTCAAPPTGRWC